MIELQVGTDPPPAEFTVDANNGMASWSLPAMKDHQNTPLAFRIRLADSLVAEPGPEANSYQFQSLHHNTGYTASISALYNWGESKIVSYTWTTDFVGVNENMRSTKVEIFPNPATSQLTIQSEEEIQQIEIFDYLGQTVLEKMVNNKQITLNTSRLEAGIYIVRVKTMKGILNRRIVIEE